MLFILGLFFIVGVFFLIFGGQTIKMVSSILNLEQQLLNPQIKHALGNDSQPFTISQSSSPSISIPSGNYIVTEESGSEGAFFDTTINKNDDGTSSLCFIANQLTNGTYAVAINQSQIQLIKGNLSAPLNMPFRVTKRNIGTLDDFINISLIKKAGNVLNTFQSGDKLEACYIADPNLIDGIKLGNNSITINQQSNLVSQSIQTNVTTEANNFTHITTYNLTAYWNNDLDQANITAYDFGDVGANAVYKANTNLNSSTFLGRYTTQNANNSGFSLPATPVVNSTNGNQTITFWARRSDMGPQGTATGFILGGVTDSAFFNGNTQLVFSMTNSSGASNSNDIRFTLKNVQDVWEHYAFVYAMNGSSLNITFYLNGILNQSANISGQNMQPQQLKFFGNRNSAGATYNGSLDDFTFYNNTLNSSQINLIYKNQSSRYDSA